MVMVAGSTTALGGSYDDQTIPGKWITPLLPEDMPEPTYADYDKDNDLEKARTQLWAGQYRRALATLSNVKKGKAIDIATIRGEAELALGRYDEALKDLGDAKIASDAGISTLRARVLAAQGKLDLAVAELNKVIAAHPDLIPPHYYAAAFTEREGDVAGALAGYQWFVADGHNYLQKWIDNSNQFNSAEDVTLIGRAIDRWASITMAYQNQRSLHDTVLSMFVRAYDLIDRDYWPAHVAAAEYFVLHDDSDQAQAELKQSLEANPDDIASWKLGARIAIDGFAFDAADQAIARIRYVDPDSIEADLLDARNLLQQRAPKLALAPLRRVLDRQPHNIEALGLLAGTYALLLQDQKTAEILKQADQIAPRDALAYVEVAEQLGAMRQYPRSAAMYRIAVDRAPWWPMPRNGLGLLYTQSGDEDSARQVLEAAHGLDPFDTRTTNYLRLLDQMKGYARKESDHFIVIYDGKQDPMIPEYFSDYLESVYPQVCGAFEYEPKVKTMIEVFPTHDEFSVRTTGAPWIATVGASTGRIIALVAPRKGSATMGPFNWSQVLRHEFTHTVTLGATDNRIAHWFTEGLAVQQEHSPVRWEWVPMLYNAVTKRQLLGMDDLTWGFVRPRRPIDRQLAYAESSWICQYIEEKYGHQAILAMLDQFRLGSSQDDVFQNSIHKSQAEFFEEFQGWCQKQVDAWGYDEATSQRAASLVEEGKNLIQRKEYAKAVTVWEMVVKLRPMDLLPHQRLAGLYMTKALNQPTKAVEQLHILSRVELNDNRFAKGAARIYRDIGDLDNAAAEGLRAVYTDPYDMSAHKLLADIYEKQNNDAGLVREQAAIAELIDWQKTNDADADGATTRPN